MMPCAHDLSTQKAAKGSQVQGHPGLHSETSYQEDTTKQNQIQLVINLLCHFIRTK